MAMCCSRLENSGVPPGNMRRLQNMQSLTTISPMRKSA
uniref:Uncharacterized protein n=1 Tax=Rhizophora mucronata TaxID=61149 RepID=A0A2P2L207_RHIMU